jgi:hypothetical protein
MEISILQRATGCGNAMCNARNVTGKGLPQVQDAMRGSKSVA